MQPVHPSTENKDLLQDLDEIVALNKASMGQRFGNFIIDYIFATIFSYAIVFPILMLLDTAGNLETVDEPSPAVKGFSLILFGLGYVVYYTLMEAINRGRTIGKMITGTYAVTIDGTALTWKKALQRSLCRAVPFEVLSGFDTPWHDQWTATTVAKK